MTQKATLLSAVETCTEYIDKVISLTESLGSRLTGDAEVTNEEIKSLLVDLYGEVDDMPRVR